MVKTISSPSHAIADRVFVWESEQPGPLCVNAVLDSIPHAAIEVDI